MSDTERRRAELRAAPGRRIIGTAMRYGAEARVLLHGETPIVERFASFAFSAYLRSGAATVLNLQHDKTLTIATTGTAAGRGKLFLRDHPDGLDLEARLPSGDVYDKVLALVEDGSTAESSVEFRALIEHVAGDLRTVRQATLPAVGIVDQGAYGSAGAVEVRARGRGLAGRLDYDKPRVTADRGEVRKELFLPGAFEYALQDEGREILLQLGDDAGQVLGSRRAGSLTLKDSSAGLSFEVAELPPTTYARDFAALMEAGTIAPGVVAFYRVPPPEAVPDAVALVADPDNAEVQIRTVRAALLTALSIRYRAPRGNPGSVERRHQRDRERQRGERARRGRRLWL